MDFESSYLGQELVKRFMERHDGLICKDVHKKLFGRTFNLKERGEDYQVYLDMNGHSHICPTVVGWTAATAVEILWDKVPGDIDLSDIPDLSDLE